MMVDVTVHQEICEHRLSLDIRFRQGGNVDKRAMLIAKHLPPPQVVRFWSEAHILANVRAHAHLLAEAHVDHGVRVVALGNHGNKAASGCCMARLVRFFCSRDDVNDPATLHSHRTLASRVLTQVFV